MVISLPYRIIAIVLALLMFTSSTGLSFDMHYCMGNLQNISIFGKAKSCHEKADEVKSSHCKKMLSACHQNTDITKTCAENNCCQNEKITLENLDNLFTNSEINEVTHLNLKVLSAFVFSYLLQYGITSNAKTEFVKFKPPPEDRDLQILYQSFLI